MTFHVPFPIYLMHVHMLCVANYENHIKLELRTTKHENYLSKYQYNN